MQHAFLLEETWHCMPDRERSQIQSLCGNQ